MRQKEDNILWIDWGSKNIWLAYMNKKGDMILPIWSLFNDESFFFTLGDVITRYKISKIVVWYPKNEEKIQEKIDNFINQLAFIVEDDVIIEKYEEDYTSVEANAEMNKEKSDSDTDTVSAIKILERYSQN